MGFSAKTTYGLQALMELADVQSSGELLQVAEIAARQAMPERYLEQMMTSLRRSGFVRSVRGARGGYTLSRPAAQISLAEVIACLDGTAEQPDPAQGSNELQVIRALGEELRLRRDQLLNSTSLSDLLTERDARLQAQAMYFI
ncbi:MAG: Rrf2 family transcriptional regulator [Vulcanococcus sp.]|uniref:Rrf2 family transcriptional regulator n=1 Tax=Vulcanococcus sp. TaxID=2856995 RepID=UPI0025D01F59|nr:Rrf2 family transcriptional regulator [Vulcanococcus sp.]MBW0173303.1 Rrf2 family transcriptional regulator [Vulcanococcus sp.]MBW0180590.1 Rrf2 family transcriptional regulator [Vulcanococcus sp.]